jgi:hypothetical protein
MTKKHFIALAAALMETRPGFVGYRKDCSDRMKVWFKDIDTVADVCARFNPNFDRERFLAACGVEEGK